MKARIPPLSVTQRKKAKAEIEKMVDATLEEKHEQAMRRYMKVTCHVLNEHFGFGKNRLSTVINEIGRLSAEADSDEIFWEHLDRIVIDFLGLPFKREDY